MKNTQHERPEGECVGPWQEILDSVLLTVLQAAECDTGCY